MVVSSSCTYISQLETGLFMQICDMTFFKSKEYTGHVPSNSKQIIAIGKSFNLILVIVKLDVLIQFCCVHHYYVKNNLYPVLPGVLIEVVFICFCF